MAFTNTLQFPNNTDGSLVFWTSSSLVLTSGNRQPDSSLVFFNPGDIGSFRRIYIVVQAFSTGGNSSFDVFWKGATEFDGIFDINHDFWTGIAITTTETVFMYWADIEGTVNVIGGTGTNSEYMFQVPYLAFGIKNAGANQSDTQTMIFAQRM